MFLHIRKHQIDLHSLQYSFINCIGTASLVRYVLTFNLAFDNYIIMWNTFHSSIRYLVTSGMYLSLILFVSKSNSNNWHQSNHCFHAILLSIKFYKNSYSGSNQVTNILADDVSDLRMTQFFLQLEVTTRGHQCRIIWPSEFDVNFILAISEH